jgi:hypothetical protein
VPCELPMKSVVTQVPSLSWNDRSQRTWTPSRRRQAPPGSVLSSVGAGPGQPELDFDDVEVDGGCVVRGADVGGVGEDRGGDAVHAVGDPAVVSVDDDRLIEQAVAWASAAFSPSTTSPSPRLAARMQRQHPSCRRSRQAEPE